MAFADPQSITVAGSAKSMPAVDRGSFRTLYQAQDENWKLLISHARINSNKKIRSVVKFSQRKVVTDPITEANDYEVSDWMIINERPVVGFTSTEVWDQLAGLKTWLDSTVGGKIYGQES